MKKTLFILVVVLMLGGCGGVTVSTQYKRLLEQQAALAKYEADHANDMTRAQLLDAVARNDCYWQQFLAASRGTEFTGPAADTCRDLMKGGQP
jgi:uncharacterized lipoprotein YmbA